MVEPLRFVMLLAGSARQDSLTTGVTTLVRLNPTLPEAAGTKEGGKYCLA